MAVHLDPPAQFEVPPISGGLFTVCMWLQVHAYPSSTSWVPLYYQGGANYNSAMMLELVNTGALGVWDNQNGRLDTASGTVPLDEWIWVAVVYEADEPAEVYWRELADTTLSSEVAQANSGAVTTVAARIAGDPPVDATVDTDIAYGRAWQARLTPGELLAESSSTEAVVTDDLWGDWPMETAATAGDDVSGEGRHLTPAQGTMTTVPGPDLADAPEIEAAGVTPGTVGAVALDRAANTVAAAGTTPSTVGAAEVEVELPTITATGSTPATAGSAALDILPPANEITASGQTPATTGTVMLESEALTPEMVAHGATPATTGHAQMIGGPASITAHGATPATTGHMEVGTLEPPVARTRAQIALNADQDRPHTWTWTTIEDRLLSSVPVSVSRGHTGESRAHRPPPGRAELHVRNYDGLFSPDNRHSPWWPHIREGLPVRVQRWHHGTWHTRLTGHIDAIRLAEDHYGVDGTATAFLSVSGELERMAQGAPGLDSPMTRLATSPANAPRLIAGWPHEDGSDATRSISPLPGVAPAIMSMPRASDDTLPGSAPLPHTSSGPGGWSCPIPPGPMLGAWHCDWWLRIDSPPEGGLLWPLMVIPVTGSAAAQFIVWLSPILGGQVWLGARDSNGSTLVLQNQAFDDRSWGWAHWRLECFQVSPTHTEWRISWVPHDEGVVFGFSGQISSQPGRPTSMDNLWRANQLPADGVSAGHMWVGVDRIRSWLSPADRAWFGEPAQQRFWRLCSEEGQRSQLIGPTGRSPQMGIQRSDVPLLDLLEEAAAVGGLLHELPDGGVGLRTTEDLLGQEPVVIPHSALTLPLSPVLDTQTTANDVTAQIPDGSKVSRVDEQHRKTVGHYADSITRSVERDDQLRHHASWRLTEGTQSRTRVPAITVDLARHPDLAPSILGLRHGDRVSVPVVSPTIPPIDLIVTGVAEELGEVTWRATLTGRPAGIWSPGVWSTRSDPGVGRGRWDSRDTRTAGPVDAETAEVDVVSTGVPWINSSDHEPLMGFGVEMGREVAQVTGITPPSPVVLNEAGVLDQFNRQVATGWGESDSGHTWQPWGTGDWSAAVTPADGAMLITGEQGTIRGTMTTGPTVHDSEVLALVDIDDSEAVSIAWELHVVSRMVNADAGYRCRLSFEPGGQLVAHWQTQSTTIGPYDDRDRFWVRLRVEGHDGSVSVWPDGDPEPAEWMLTGPVAPINRQPAGQLGVALDVNLFQAARPIVRVHSIEQTVLTPAHAQTMTLTRPTPSTHPPATRLRVAEQDRWRWATPGKHHHAAP